MLPAPRRIFPAGADRFRHISISGFDPVPLFLCPARPVPFVVPLMNVPLIGDSPGLPAGG
jgi:hypothetical protein